MFEQFFDDVAEDSSVVLVVVSVLSLGAVFINSLGHVVRFFG